MPYSIDNPPDRISNLPKQAQRIWISAFNNAIEDNDEESANKIAWDAVKRKYKKSGDNWTKRSGSEEEDNKPNKENMSGEYSYALKLDESIGGDVPDTSKIQIIPTGSWKHDEYGKIEIDEKDIEKFKQHYEEEVRNDVPITAGHAKPGEEKPAVGWFKELINKGSDGLWGVVKWTEKGKELLKDEAFKYFSPEFHDKYEDPETHETYENVLVGGALTNKPYFKGLQGVALSELFSDLNLKNMSEEEKDEEVEEEDDEPF